MQQLTFVSRNNLEWREVRTPVIVDATDAIVRPIASTTCDIDQGIIRGQTPLEGPFAIGHECVAEVLEIGDEVKSIAPGDVVCVPWHIACGVCKTCKSGLTASCEVFPPKAMYGATLGGEWGGLFDDVVRVPFGGNMLVKVPDGVNPHHVASFSDNVGVGWEVVKKHIEKTPGARVLVAGGSPSIGLFVADVAHALGAEVHYVDFSSQRLDVARAIGVTTHKGFPAPELGKFDLAIDASANPEALREVMLMLKPEGHCESVGIYFDDILFPMYEMYLRGVTFRIGRGNARAQLPFILDLKKRGCIHPEHVHTATHSFDEIIENIVASNKPLFIRDRIT